MKLPPLPKKNRVQTHGYNTTTAYTAQQMKDYGHECAEAMREECLRLAELYGAESWAPIKALEIEG